MKKIKDKKFYLNKLKKIFLRFNNFDFNKPVLIFGAGTVGRYLLKILKKKKVRVIHFVDNNPNLINKYLEQIKVISYEELKNNFRKEQIIIASIIYEKEIYIQLRKDKFPNIFPLTYLNYSFPDIFNYRKYNDLFNSIFENNNREKIRKAYKLFVDQQSKSLFSKIINFRLRFYFLQDIGSIKSVEDQYFDKEMFSFHDKEIFVDGGGYIGDTINIFLKRYSNLFEDIYSFEPDSKNFEMLNKKYKNKRIHLIKAGLYNLDGLISFFDQVGPESTIIEGNTVNLLSGGLVKIKKKDKISKIKVCTLDTFFKNKKPPTLIKMDIEGAEIKALLGAKKIINKYKPKLAICVYHKPTDLWEIPLLIKKLNNNYRIYLRHYSKELCETVCYAL